MTFKVKDGLVVGNNIFVNSTLDVNANTITVSNSMSVGGAIINSTFFSGIANNAYYVFGGKTEEAINANSATYATNAQFAYTANVANYAYNGKSEESLNANSARYATNAQFAYVANVALYAYGGKSEESLNANAALYANYATYAGIANQALYAYNGKSEEALNANSATYSVNAQFAYVANVANYAYGGKAENALGANSATYATNAQFAYVANVANYAYGGKAEESLNANSARYATNAQFAYTANIANYLNGKAENALDANTALYANYATYSGTANVALYSYGGKSEESLNANSARYATNAQFAYTANIANYLNGKAESALDANTALYANYATYAGIANVALYSYGGKSEEALNANSATYATNAQFAYTANTANYLNGVAANALSTNSALYANYATYAGIANTALYSYGGKSEESLNANSSTYSTNAQFAYIANSANFLNGVAPSALSTNSATYATNAQFAYTANVANYLNGKAENALDANTAQYLGGFDSAYYTNATNITTGTLAEPRLPFRMDQNVRTTDDVLFSNGTFTGTVSIGGDLVLTGNLYSTNVQSLSVADPLVKLGSNNNADTLWSGFVTHYSGSGYTNNHTGLVRNPSTKEYILMSTYGDETSVNNNIIVVTDPSFTYANLAVNSIKLGNNTLYSTLDRNVYSGTANNSAYAYGKQESQLSVANAVFALSANIATYAFGKQESQLNVASANTSNISNNSTYAYGKQESQLSVANAVFANTSNYLNGKSDAFFSNASNITNGTLPWEVLPPNSVNSSSSASITGTWTFDDIVVTGGINDGASYGGANEVLASDGAGGVFWKQDAGSTYYLNSTANNEFGVIRLRNANNVNNDVVLVGNGTSRVFSNSQYVIVETQDQYVGTVTVVDSGSGLLGGPITDTGSLYVGAGAGISVNMDDVAVNAKEGLVANSSGLWVNTAYFTLLSGSVSANNSATLQFKTWEEPGSIGSITPNDGNFVTLQANTVYVRANVIANGYISVGNTVINSTYFPASANNSYHVYGKREIQLNVNSALFTSGSNNASYLDGYRWETPAAIGSVTANTGNFTYANVTSHVAFGVTAHMMAMDKLTITSAIPVNILEFSTTTYSGGKLIIEATDTQTNFRHISEMLIAHDGTNVSATEYGVIQTSNTILATFETVIVSGNVRLLARPVSMNPTTFKIIQNLFLI